MADDAQPYEDEPTDGDWVTCWCCGGEGGEEGDDPLWDLGEWITCDICHGEGGWPYQHPDHPQQQEPGA